MARIPHFERDKENRKRSRQNRQGLISQVRKDLNKVNPKAAESLADPEEYLNLFEDWQVALAIESKAAETLNVYPPAEQYISHAGKQIRSIITFLKQLKVSPSM